MEHSIPFHLRHVPPAPLHFEATKSPGKQPSLVFDVRTLKTQDPHKFSDVIRVYYWASESDNSVLYRGGWGGGGLGWDPPRLISSIFGPQKQPQST